MTHDSYAAVLSIVNLMACYFLDYTILKLLPDNESFGAKSLNSINRISEWSEKLKFWVRPSSGHLLV